MANARFTEKPDSRVVGGDYDNPTITTQWRGRGYATEILAYAAALSFTPFAYNHPSGYTLYRQPPQVTESGHQIYDVSVSYEKRKSVEGDWNFDFDVSGGTMRIKESIELISKHAVAGAVAQGTIGKPFRIGEQGESVQGIDVVIPSGRFSFTFRHPAGEVTLAYMLAIDDYVGYVNSAAWGPFPAKTVLFNGVRGSDGREQPAEISYSFLYQKGVQGQEINGMPNIDKDGWDVLDITYEDKDDNNEKSKRPRFVHIHRVYEKIDFENVFPFTPA